MKVMIIVKANEDTEAEVLSSAQVFRSMTDYNEQLVKAGVLLAGEGLYPSSKAKRVRCVGKGRTVIDGPFAESSELVAGFWLWQVKSLDEAVEWVRRSPFQEGEIEIRPVFEAEDFANGAPPDVDERERGLRARTAQKSP